MENAWLIYDADCNFCIRAVRWVTERDGAHHFCTVPCPNAASPPTMPRLARECSQAVYVITADGRSLKAGRACLYVLEHIGFGTLARVLGSSALVWLVEAAYRFVARNRRLFGRILFRGEATDGDEACGIPGRQDRAN